MFFIHTQTQLSKSVKSQNQAVECHAASHRGIVAASILCISAAAAGGGGSEGDGSAGASSWYCQKDAKVNSVAQLCFGDEREQFK